MKSRIITISVFLILLSCIQINPVDARRIYKPVPVTQNKQSPLNKAMYPNNGLIYLEQSTILTSVYASTNAKDIKYCFVKLAADFEDNAGYILYDAAGNRLSLVNGAGRFIGFYKPGSSRTIENGSVILNCKNTKVVTTGSDITITWDITLKSSHFTGNKIYAFMQVINKKKQVDLWEQMGDFTVYRSDPLEIASLSSANEQGNNHSTNPAISANGRFAVFQSAATNLVPGDNNGFIDIFVRDRDTNITEIISVDPDGLSCNGDSINPAISADGRYVVFESFASNIVDSDDDGGGIFVRDLLNNSTVRVSSSGINPSISADGRYIVFEDGNIKIKDMINNTIESLTIFGYTPVISGNGRYIVFESSSMLIPGGNVDPLNEIFIYDRADQLIERVSVSSDGVPTNGFCHNPSVSDDGRYVVFASAADNLTSDIGYGTWKIFCRDRDAGTTRSVAFDVAFGGYYPSISGDGRYVLFTEIYGIGNIIKWDNQTGLSALIENNSNSVFMTAISYDGSFSAFDSESADLVAGDANSASDIFIHIQN